MQKTLLFFHGNAGNASHRLYDAEALKALGLNVLLVDYQGYGLSEGKASEIALYQDAEASLNYLKTSFNLKDEDIIEYKGESEWVEIDSDQITFYIADHQDQFDTIQVVVL